MRAAALSRACLLIVLAACGLAEARANGCNLTGGWVAFGAYNPSAAADLDTVGVLALDCHEEVRAEISLSKGAGAGASYAGGRRMTRVGGQGVLVYNVYADPARSQVLGDGTAGSVVLRVNGKKDQKLVLYGRMPRLQRNVPAGQYADLIVTTISY